MAVPFLLDTNILLRLSARTGPDGVLARRAVAMLQNHQHPLYFTLQNLTEFWNVGTREASKNGLGFTIDEVEQSASDLELAFGFLTDMTAVLREWRRLVWKHAVRGTQVYDGRPTASMIAHDITHILTFNTRDFQRPSEIAAVHPSEIGN